MKDDTISRRGAIKAIKDALLSWSNMQEWREDKIVGALDKLPTVDAVPVVRCRDCEYWDTIPRSTVAPLHHQCKETRLMTTGIWYCPLGKRKDGDGNG